MWIDFIDPLALPAHSTRRRHHASKRSQILFDEGKLPPIGFMPTSNFNLANFEVLHLNTANFTVKFEDTATGKNLQPFEANKIATFLVIHM